MASFTGRDGHRIVEPGELELRFAASSTDADSDVGTPQRPGAGRTPSRTVFAGHADTPP
ncbi:hypothetical protein [Streptomyces sp. DHE17-7]|uniref:hypothetical protein n=1 Tax=Streptomyces sp. DHE17-7 TaxID=2759949 RepID=UPI003FA68429